MSPRPSHNLQTHPGFGFRAARGVPVEMKAAHVHNDIELNFVLRGSLRYFVAGHFETIRAGRLALLWAGVPHQVVWRADDSKFIWITIPLAWFMQWEIPEPIRRRLLRGELLLDPDKSPETLKLDRLQVERWVNDLRRWSPPELRRIAEMEVRARLQRLALGVAHTEKAAATPATVGGTQIERAARHIGEHYAELESVAEVAHAIGLHPNYLMQLFKRHTGMSLWDYIIRLRISHAQRLLMTTDLKVLDIALESGFGSVSRFHDAFQRLCRCSPRQYRAALNLPARKSGPAS